ncbi:MAG: hypothetical protein ACFFG0_04815 [Candidatus Thorarchaeota archaeon]
MFDCKDIEICWNKLYEYVKAIYDKLNYGYIYNLTDLHNELNGRIGNILLTLGNKLNKNKELQLVYKNLKWREEFRT